MAMYRMQLRKPVGAWEDLIITAEQEADNPDEGWKACVKYFKDNEVPIEKHWWFKSFQIKDEEGNYKDV